MTCTTDPNRCEYAQPDAGCPEEPYCTEYKQTCMYASEDMAESYEINENVFD